MASARQTSSSPFEMGIHLPPNLTSGVGESGISFPLPSSQRSKSETLHMKHFPMPPALPIFGRDMHSKLSSPAHSLSPPVMDWGIPDLFGNGLDGGRAAAIDRVLAGSPPHLQVCT
jgi:hypothetical protein